MTSDQKEKASDHGNNGKSTSVSALFDELIKDFDKPFYPPAIPSTGDEALFFLAPGGRNALGEVYEFLDRYLSLLRKRWLGKTPEYLQGFGDLSNWLSITVKMAFPHRLLEDDLCGNLLLNAKRMEEFTHNTEAMKAIEEIEELRWNVMAICLAATELWGYSSYFRVLTEQIEEVTTLFPSSEGSGIFEKEGWNREIKQAIYTKLENYGLFDTHFFDSNHEGESWLVECEGFKNDIAAFREKLGNRYTTLGEITHYIKELSGKTYYFVSSCIPPSREMEIDQCDYGVPATLKGAQNARFPALAAGKFDSPYDNSDKSTLQSHKPVQKRPKSTKELSIYPYVVAAIVWLSNNREGIFKNRDILDEITEPHTPGAFALSLTKYRNTMISHVKQHLKGELKISFEDEHNTHSYRPTSEGLKKLEKELESLNISSIRNSAKDPQHP